MKIAIDIKNKVSQVRLYEECGKAYEIFSKKEISGLRIFRNTIETTYFRDEKTKEEFPETSLEYLEDSILEDLYEEEYDIIKVGDPILYKKENTICKRPFIICIIGEKAFCYVFETAEEANTAYQMIILENPQLSILK